MTIIIISTSHQHCILTWDLEKIYFRVSHIFSRLQKTSIDLLNPSPVPSDDNLSFQMTALFSLLRKENSTACFAFSARNAQYPNRFALTTLMINTEHNKIRFSDSHVKGTCMLPVATARLCVFLQVDFYLQYRILYF